MTGRVNFLMLPDEQGRLLWKLHLAGREWVVLSSNARLSEAADQLRLEFVSPETAKLVVFPTVNMSAAAASR